MSRPPAPSSLHPSTSETTTNTATMMETQRAPNFPPPSFLGHPNRRLPQPVQLPPLTIPHHAGAAERHPSLAQPLPSIYNAPSVRHPSNHPPTPHAPASKLLTANPYATPRQEPTYSQQYASRRSPRSELGPHMHQRRLSDRYPPDAMRAAKIDSQYASPVEGLPRPSYPPLPSPTYTPSYSSSHASHATYRSSIGSHRSSIGSSLAQLPQPEPPAVTSRPASSAGPSTVPTAGSQGHTDEKTKLRYEICLRQQPAAARACEFGERDRRVIDPPPIVELKVTDPVTSRADHDELRYSLNVVHCTLWNAEGTSEETALMQPDRRTTRRLMGQLVASPSLAKDEHDVEGCFFCFPDLSCRTAGRYRLRFVLMRIDPMNLHVGGFSPILTDVLSDVFTVYTAKDFPGMRPSSALTRALKLQGCNIQVKKGNEKSLARRRRQASGEDEDEEGGAVSPRGAKRRRPE